MHSQHPLLYCDKYIIPGAKHNIHSINTVKSNQLLKEINRIRSNYIFFVLHKSSLLKPYGSEHGVKRTEKRF